MAQPQADSSEATEAARSSRLPEIVLVFVTIVWGSTFFATQTMLRESGPLAVLAIRFAVGALALLLVIGPRIRKLSRLEIWAGVGIGIVIFASYALQTAGLEEIPSSRSAFITAMYVPMVPLLQVALTRRSPAFSAWLGIVISFAGLMVLSRGERVGGGMGLGEWLTLGGAIMAAFQIVLLSRWGPGTNAIRLTFVQLATVALLAFVAMPIFGETMPEPSPTIIGLGLALGLVGTAFALGAMAWAQQTVPATQATVIYSLEPVWAGVIGAIAGELMNAGTILGSTLILVGVLVSELWPRGRVKSEERRAKDVGKA